MIDYRFASINEIHNAYRDRKLTVRELVVSFLDAIAKLDQGEDGLHAVMEVNPDALFIAKAIDQQLDSMLQSGTPLPPLFGIPVLLKDNINTADRLPHHCWYSSLKRFICSLRCHHHGQAA